MARTGPYDSITGILAATGDVRVEADWIGQSPAGNVPS